MNPSITAVVCTRNRADHLRKAIERLVLQILPHDEYEILVVGNASPGNTRERCDAGLTHLACRVAGEGA